MVWKEKLYMNDLSYIVVLAITVLMLVMQMKKYMDLKRIVKNVADVRVIEGNRKIQYVFFLLAIVSLAVCAVLLVVPLVCFICMGALCCVSDKCAQLCNDTVSV